MMYQTTTISNVAISSYDHRWSAPTLHGI